MPSVVATFYAKKVAKSEVVEVFLAVKSYLAHELPVAFVSV